MNKQFEIAGGSIIGKDHLRSLLWKNNQDGFCWMANKQAIIALVTDGCGSSPHSEVGAKLGARLIVESITGYMADYERYASRLFVRQLEEKISFPFWEEVKKDVLARLRILIKEMGGNFIKTANEYFLFSLVGALITPWGSSIFSIGDGVFFVNGKMTLIGPFPRNAPPYLAHDLIKTSLKITNPGLLKFQIHQLTPTSQIESILIGTDGASGLTKLAEEKTSGRRNKVSSISQFWEDDCYFVNPDQIRRHLALLNKLYVKLDWENKQIIRESGILPDDTTIVVIRRKNIKEREVR